MSLRGRLVVILLAASVAAGAADLESSVYVRGFVSQGYINSEDNNYLLPNDREGSGEFNEAAVTIAAEPAERVHVGIQLLGRDFGLRKTSNVVVDWAYGDFRWRDEVGFRAGKIKLPYGLYNQTRDVDMLRTSVLLPQSVYAEKDRDLLIAFEGVGLYGNVVLGSWGDFDYELSFGSLNLPEDGHADTQELLNMVAHAGEAAVAADVSVMAGVPVDSVRASLHELEATELDVPWILGGALIWNAPVQGLRIGYTYMEGDADASARARYDTFVGTGGAVPAYMPVTRGVAVDFDLRTIVTGSVEYQRGPWLLVSEFSRLRAGDNSSIGWYAGTDYRWSPAVAVQGCWSTYYPDENDRSGAAREAVGDPDYYAWQHDLGLAVRLDLNEHWLVKFEYHHMDGAALADICGLGAGETASRRWHVLAAKTTFHF